MPPTAAPSWYQRLFPHTRISPSKNQESNYETTRRGYRYTTSIGGTLTGRGGDLLIIDDPLKPEDAMSEARREAANGWYSRTALSRLCPHRGRACLVARTRGMARRFADGAGCVPARTP